MEEEGEEWDVGAWMGGAWVRQAGEWVGRTLRSRHVGYLANKGVAGQVMGLFRGKE